MKPLIRNQYAAKFDQLIDLQDLICPKEGWIRTLRKALGMSSPQLAKHMNISKSQASQMERMEIEDRITLKQLRRVADSLGCDLRYALVPKKPIKVMVRDRARLKAEKLVSRANIQMKLEAQQLSNESLKSQVDMEIDRLVAEMPRGLWDD